jgi:peptide chain release factor 2
LSAKTERAAVLAKQAADPHIWDDPDNARAVTSELSQLQDDVALFDRLETEAADIAELNQMNLAEEDASLSDELERELTALAAEVDRLEIQSHFSGPYDAKDALMSIHPGAGGTESQDWAEMLLRMYVMWAEKKSFKVEINDYLPGEEAGLKSVTFSIHGRNAFGMLDGEKGVHRLVRISPYDQAKRRHTSFASVDVIPIVAEDVDVEINPEDLRIDTYRASGAGGQHVNKTDSAVRITHLPTGLVVQCQNERSQLKNKQGAMKILKARIFNLRREEQEKKVAALRGAQSDIAFGSQIRSYVFHPYQMVKDHRTDQETGDIQKVMDGGLDPFIEAYLTKVK